MRERAASVDGALSVKSAPRTGTEIEVRIPLPRGPATDLTAEVDIWTF